LPRCGNAKKIPRTASSINFDNWLAGSESIPDVEDCRLPQRVQ
jgi:hypothetical protein